MGWRGTWMGSIDKCDRKPFKLKGTLVAHIRKRHKDDPEAMEAIHKIQPNIKKDEEERWNENRRKYVQRKQPQEERGKIYKSEYCDKTFKDSTF